MTRVPTTPLNGPLDGGSDSASVRVHPLLSGEILAPSALLDRQTPFAMARAIGVGVPKSRRIWIPVPVFLIEHPAAGAVLIDTGAHPRAPDDPRRTMGVVSSLLYGFRTGPDGDLPTQLRDRGIRQSDVRVVVMTHLHADHASAISEFPQAKFVVAGREWDAANSRSGFANGYAAKHFSHRFDWRLVDFDGPGVAPSAGFGRTVDLFGDRSVRMLATPGHTPGHLSVLVRLGAGELLITADAAYTRRTISDSVLPGIARDYDQFRDSLRQIQRYVERRPDAVVITGHDPELWATLEPVYA